MPSHSFPLCGGESCTRSSPVTTSISPCALTFTPATRSPAATTALTALVRSLWRKADGRRVIASRPSYRLGGRVLAPGGPPGRGPEARVGELLGFLDAYCRDETTHLQCPPAEPSHGHSARRHWVSAL